MYYIVMQFNINMSNISIRIPNELNEALISISLEIERSKSWIIKKALENYLEDIHDYNDGMTALKKFEANNEETYNLDEVKKMADLED